MMMLRGPGSRINISTTFECLHEFRHVPVAADAVEAAPGIDEARAASGCSCASKRPTRSPPSCARPSPPGTLPDLNDSRCTSPSGPRTRRRRTPIGAPPGVTWPGALPARHIDRSPRWRPFSPHRDSRSFLHQLAQNRPPRLHARLLEARQTVKQRRCLERRPGTPSPGPEAWRFPLQVSRLATGGVSFWCLKAARLSGRCAATLLPKFNNPRDTPRIRLHMFLRARFIRV